MGRSYLSAGARLPDAKPSWIRPKQPLCQGICPGGQLAIPDLEPEQSITSALGHLYNSALRILLYRGRARHDPISLQDGIKLADNLVERALHGSYIPIALEALLLRAQMYAARGDEPASLEDVLRALELAEPEGFISIFIEEGQPIAESLAALLQRNPAGGVGPEYIQKILAACLKPKPSGEPKKQSAPPVLEPSIENPLPEPLSRASWRC